MAAIHTVLVNVSGSVDGLGGIEWVLAPSRLMVPAMVTMPMGFVVRARIAVDVGHYFVRCY